MTNALGPDQPTTVCLITGSTRGIGLETARQLLARGCTTIISGRTLAISEEAAASLDPTGRYAVAIELDVTNPASVTAAAESIGNRFDRLDVLVNNAGVRLEPYGLRPSEQDIDLWERTFKVNIFGMVRVTKAMLPLMRRSSAPRIVNVSSLLGSIDTHQNRNSYTYTDSFKSLPAYSASKSAVNSWTVHLAYELHNTPFKVNAVHPGYSKTDMNDGAGDFTAAQGARTSVSLALLDGEGPTGGFLHGDATVPW